MINSDSDEALKSLEKGRLNTPEYHHEIDSLFTSTIPAGCRVLELGCSTGRLLAALKPSFGLGVDKDPKKIEAAKMLCADRPELEFREIDVERCDWRGMEPFDYIVLSDLMPVLVDVQATLVRLHKVCSPSTRLVMNFPSNLWRPLLALAVWTGRRSPDEAFNWLSVSDVSNLLYLSGFETVTKGGRALLPLKIPLLGWLLNRVVAKLPLFHHLCASCYIVARPIPEGSGEDESVSVVIPTKDEKGNIEPAFMRTPRMGRWTELVFIDGNSVDGTFEEIQRCAEKYGGNWHRVKVIQQTGKGKGQAVHQAFHECEGNILMILDSDLTMPPEELPKYYDAIIAGKGEFINGCRLVYPMEGRAMRFLNMIANYLFAHIFSWLLSQPVKDTLCGTKVFRASDYRTVWQNRSYFGDFDPFGDFDLLFGMARINRRIVDLPIRYRDRTYGDIKISRWRHGVLLLRMCFVALLKLKLR